MKPSSKLPHLEYSRSGFYWRRRIPERDLNVSIAASGFVAKIGLKS